MRANRKYLATLMALCLIPAGLASVLGALGFRINVTPSVPRGLYRVGGERLARGGLVAFCLAPDNPFSGLAARRGYLGEGNCPSGSRELLKRVRGLPGDLVEASVAGLRVNGTPLPGSARPGADSLGRSMPPSLLASGHIPEGRILVMSDDAPHGFDGRHFGLIPEEIATSVEEIMTF